jgi:uncharacterized protein with PhoU and TrkA domain
VPLALGAIGVACPWRLVRQRKELALRNEYGVNLIALQRTMSVQADPDAPATTTTAIVAPNANATILPSDVLILVGSNESLTHLSRD